MPRLSSLSPPEKARIARVHLPNAGHGPIRRGQPLWLFDLDNTLHDTSHRIFAEINLGMTAAVMESLGVDQETANTLRAKYWRKYGATMIGMEKHHGVSPREFLHRSHDFDVRPLLRSIKGLPQKLKRLPGRKVLVTNAPLHYSRAVLKHLGILRCFDSIWAIEHMRIHGTFKPKPSATLMRYILSHEGVHPSKAVLIEDTLSNLKGARAAGLKTIHVYHPGTPFSHGKRGRPSFVDLRVNCVSELLLQRRPLR